jgi:hypothetical protein
MNSDNISFQQSLKFGEKCINSCLLVNGGAAIALLALLSTLISEHYFYSVNFIIYALWAFLLGLLLAAAAYGFAFFAQEKITLNKSAKKMRYLTISFIIGSLICFVVGGSLASWPFLKLATNTAFKNCCHKSITGKHHEAQKLWTL